MNNFHEKLLPMAKLFVLLATLRPGNSLDNEKESLGFLDKDLSN